MSDDHIRNLPKHRKAREEVDAIMAALKMARTLSPLLPKSVREALAGIAPSEIEGIRERMDHLSSLSDYFNEQFAELGWVMFEGMNADIAAKAVELAEARKPDEAEQVLADFWTVGIIQFHITRLKRVDAFAARWRLAVDAESLYGEGHYHACTLLVLAALDGMVQETCARHLGVNQNFSAEKTILEAWNSIAGHSTGLGKLKQVMLSPRKKTNLDLVMIPYRHGIVHGMDVNFNTKLVAAKAWAALFAVGEWAYLAQQGKLAEPEPVETKSALQELREVSETLKEAQQLKAAMQAFKPRTLWEEGLIPATGSPDDYGPGTPERALVQFLVWWQASNYGKMAGAITTKGNRAERPADLRAWFDGKTLQSFEITKVEDQAIARAVASVRLNVKESRHEWTTDVDVVMIKKLESGSKEELERCPWTFTNYYDLAREPKEDAL